MAIPALIVAAIVVCLGGGVFALALLVLGVLCMHELFVDVRQRQARRGSAGFIGLSALIAVAQLSGEHVGRPDQVFEALVFTLPVVFIVGALQAARRPARRGSRDDARRSCGSALALAHAVLLRDLPHGDGIVVDVLVGTFVGDSARVPRRTRVRPQAARAADLAEQDGRGAGHRDRRRRDRASGSRACTRTG